MPESQKTDFTNEELLDILDFYTQYKPLFDESSTNKDNYPLTVAAHDFTILLYKYELIDRNYSENLTKIKSKYDKIYIDDLSKEKLDFFEIMTIFTFIHRADCFSGGWYEDCIEDNTYYNLLSRLEEIKNDIIKIPINYGHYHLKLTFEM